MIDINGLDKKRNCKICHENVIAMGWKADHFSANICFSAK